MSPWAPQEAFPMLALHIKQNKAHPLSKPVVSVYTMKSAKIGPCPLKASNGPIPLINRHLACRSPHSQASAFLLWEATCGLSICNAFQKNTCQGRSPKQGCEHAPGCGPPTAFHLVPSKAAWGGQAIQHPPILAWVYPTLKYCLEMYSSLQPLLS